MLEYINNYWGETAALTAAFLWAVSSLIYARLGVKLSPLQLNLYKGIIAIALILVTLVWQGKLLADVSIYTIAWLFLSGVIGIGLGDTAYFFALNSLGARRTLLLETASPPMGALLAMVIIGEQLTPVGWSGIFLTILGIAWVISERNPIDAQGISTYGIIYGLLAAIAQALGAVISRFALIQSQISPLESTLIRLIGGTIIVLSLLFIFHTSRPIKINWHLSGKNLGIIAIAATMSTYLGIWLQQTSLKFAPTGIAQTLLATSPLFILPLVTWQGEKITLRGFLGACLALVGIGLMFIR